MMISFSLQQFLYWVSRILYPLDFLLPFWLFPPSLISSNFLKLGYPSSWIFFLSLPTPRSHPVHGFTICMLMVPIFIAEVHTSPLNSRLVQLTNYLPSSHRNPINKLNLIHQKLNSRSSHPLPTNTNSLSVFLILENDNSVLPST